MSSTQDTASLSGEAYELQDSERASTGSEIDPIETEKENIAGYKIEKKDDERKEEFEEALNLKKRSNEDLDTDQLCQENTEQPLTKRQRKKLLKQQKYEEIKKMRKEKRKQKKQLKREQRELEGDKDAQPINDQPVIKYRTMDSPDALPLKIAIDLSFDDLMSDKDISKLTKQLQRCYSLNRRSQHPLQLYFTSFGDKCKKRLDELQGHYVSWDVHIKTDHLTEIFPTEEIVYLTSDSSNVLTDFDMSKTYVIGGLVDHNHHKGLCYNLAVAKGLGHAQLPIGDYFKMTTRTVMTVNQVYEIIMHYMESKDWQDAFVKVMPQRKITPKVKRHRYKNKDNNGTEKKGNSNDEGDGNDEKDDSS